MWIRHVAPVALLAVPSAGLGAAGCGLDLQGELVELGDASPLQSGQSSGGLTGGSSSGGGGTSSGGPASDDGSALSDGAGDDSGSTNTPDGGSSTCDFDGTWATKITIDVSWVPQGLMGVILAPGTGKIQQWIKSVRVVKGTSTTDTAVVCGIALPDFSGTSFVGGETYGVRFPPSLFDSGFLPSFAIFGTMGGTSPTSTFVTTTSATLIGLTLANPTTAAWPATITTAVDSDMDGNPGVTVSAAVGPIPGKDGGVYSEFPVDVLADRANELFIVIRQVTQLSGAATDCNHIAGTTTIPKIPNTSSGKYGIDSHVIGCNLAAGGMCSQSQINFIDGTQPVFSPSGAATFASLRMKSGATCDDARSALPQE
jgi:hypothetical protein